MFIKRCSGWGQLAEIILSVKYEAKSSAEIGVGCQRQRILLEETRELFYRENTAAYRAGRKPNRGVTVLTTGRLPGGLRGSWVLKNQQRLLIHWEVGSVIKVPKMQRRSDTCHNVTDSQVTIITLHHVLSILPFNDTKTETDHCINVQTSPNRPLG